MAIEQVGPGNVSASYGPRAVDNSNSFPLTQAYGEVYAGDDGDNVNSLTQTQVLVVQSLVSGDRVADSVSRNITVDDNAKFLAPTGTLTYTIPEGLSPMPSFTVDCPASGTISIAKSGAVTINGAATTLTRTRVSNPVGFVVLAHESNAYGVSGA